MKNLILGTICLIFSLPFFAQESNVFHDRAFWKTNPDIATIDKHIAAGHSISSLNQHAFDAVSWALIEKTDNETVKYLLSKKGNDVNKLTHDARTYIFWAAYKDNLEMMQYLLDNGAKTDIIDSHGYSVLNFAAVTGQTNPKLYDFLLKHGANPKTEKNHDGANALLLVAPFLENGALVDYFTSKGLSLKTTDTNGNGIFAYAAKGGNTKFLEWLIKNDVAIDKNTMVLASQGLRRQKNTLETYQFLERKGVAVNVIDHDGKNPLHAIAYDIEDLDVFKFFIDHGLDINHKDHNGNSPFMNAAMVNSMEVVTFLSDYVKDVNATNKEGRSALAMAVSRNTVEVVKFLIEKGAEVNGIDAKGNSLAYELLNTYRNSKNEAFDTKLKVLTKAGLDVSKTQGDGKTLYHLAVEKQNLELLKRLKDFKIDINAKNNDGLTPLHLAAMKAENLDIINYLIAIGADKTLKTDFDETVYDLARENEKLQQNKVDISFLK